MIVKTLLLMICLFISAISYRIGKHDYEKLQELNVKEMSARIFLKHIRWIAFSALLAGISVPIYILNVVLSLH